MNHRRKLILVTAAALSLGGGVDPVAAQVFIDPGSPSAKEYAIPLEDVRRQNSSDNDSPVAQGERTATLFGEGVGDGNATAPAAPVDSAAGGKSSVRPDGSQSGGRSSNKAKSVIAGTARPVGATIPQGGLGSTATIAALALSVLLLGGVIGSIARRRTS